MRSQTDSAREQFETVLANHPNSEEAHLGLAEVESLAGNLTQARDHLAAIIQKNGHHAVAHQRQLTLTGPAPQTKLVGQEALDAAQAHPYDTRALLRAAMAFAGNDQNETAIRILQRILWLGDVHKRTTVAALRRLRSLSPEWRRRKIVEVHVYADEALRAHEGWRFRVRDAWRAASRALSEIIDIRFVPITIAPFQSAGVSASLDQISAAMQRQMQPVPPRGLIAGMTGRPPPRVRGYGWKLGLAQLLGRRMILRFPDDGLPTWVLAHEILHLFGAIHVSDDLPSIMNRTGEARGIDPFNLRIVQSTKRRTFAVGGVGRNVLNHVDMNETIEAYVEAMNANLVLRRMGVQNAVREARRSRYKAGRDLKKIQDFDPQLAEMASIVSRMMRVEGRRVEAVLMLETSAQLYGLETVRGRAALEEAQALRRNIERQLR